MGRLAPFCSLKWTVLSSKYWSLVPGCPRLPSQSPIFRISPTAIWTLFLLVVWWQLKRSCNSLALSTTGIVTFIHVFLWRSVTCGHLDSQVQDADVFLLPTLLFFLRSRELQQPYTLEPLLRVWSVLLVTVTPFDYTQQLLCHLVWDIIAKHLDC